MNRLRYTENHQPQMRYDTIGLGGFDPKRMEPVFCLLANDDNNFLNEGIVLNSQLFVDPNAEFREGALNVFRQNNYDYPFKLYRTVFPDGEYVGRIIMTVNYYGD